MLLKVKCYSCNKEWKESYPIKDYCTHCNSDNIWVMGKYNDNNDNVQLGIHAGKGKQGSW